MRVVEIVESSAGGSGRHVIDLCCELAKRRVEVHLLYSPARIDGMFRDNLQRCKECGVIIRPIFMHRRPHLSDLRSILEIWAYLRAHGPFDIVHGHSSKAGAIARLLRILGGPVTVYTPHAFLTLNPALSRLERVTYGMIERVLGLLTDIIITVSIDEYREALRLGIPKDKLRMIPNGIPLSRGGCEDREKVRTHFGIAPGEVVVGFVGRFVLQKAPGLLLAAFARLVDRCKNSRLVMVGEGPLFSDLKRESQRLGIEKHVVWPGYMDGRVAMEAFDVFALPSSYEGFAYTLLEAMAAGLPVVTTRVGGTDLAVEHGANGYVVPVGDVEGFADALVCLCSDPDRRTRFSERSLQKVALFNIDEMIDKTIDAYRRASKSKIVESDHALTPAGGDE